MTVTIFSRSGALFSYNVVCATGTLARVKAVSVFVSAATCALSEQLGVSMESAMDSIVASVSSPDSLKETLVEAAAHAALQGSAKPPTSVGSYRGGLTM